MNASTRTAAAAAPQSTVDGPALTGRALIADHVTRLPERPGVYRMIGEKETVLYVGKAKNLRSRVSSYARGKGHANRITRMINLTRAMEFVVTKTETEALLLESNLIKRLKPRFNVLLRDDKSFPYILIRRDHEAPQIVKHRGARGKRGDYFGPFANTGAVNRTVSSLQRAFLLRTCTDSVYESRTRPCLLYQIKRCAAPCTGEIAPEGYRALVDETVAFLDGKSHKVREAMAMQMEIAAERMDFETAAVYRDRLQALSMIQSHQGINPRGIDEADVFAVHQDGGQTCVQVFFFRMGQNWGNRAVFPKADADMEPEELLTGFLGQFYEDAPAPRLVLTSHAVEDPDVLSQAFGEVSGHKVEILRPQRGERRQIVDYALQNAREALGRRLAETGSQSRLLAGLAEAFDLPYPPRRVEIYDNSHIMGTNAVGAMIVAGREGFAKNQYRKYNFKDEATTPGDDYAMMREMLTRRFQRLVKDETPRTEPGDGDAGDDEMPAWPDVVFVDGGAGQLSAACEVLKELGIDDQPVIGIAKGPDRDAGREQFHMPGRTPFMLPPRDPVLYFIQRLRDESHRFAIGTHRAKRKKAMGVNPLDEIAGIGPTRKRALMHHFGTAKGVSRAALEDLQGVPGVSATMARAIYDHFHEGS